MQTGSRINAFHVTVVALSLLLTLAAWQFSKMQIETRTQQRFDVAAENTAALIVERLSRYEDALWSGVAAVASHEGDIGFSDWRAFAQNLQLEQKYPGTNGIGVIHHLTAAALPTYLDRQHIERPDFTVQPSHNFPYYMPITVITPLQGNEAAVGLDVAHEVNRRTAAFASRDTGTAQITGPITLVQDSRSTPGFLFYAPFYAAGPLDTVAQRQKQFAGAVYAPIIVEKLMEGLLSNNLRQVSFSLKDGKTTIYDEHNRHSAAIDPDPMHKTRIPIPFYGREWVLDIQSDLAFRAANVYHQPMFILIGGLIVEGLIVALLVLMSRANQNAIAYATTVTTRLRRQSSELEQTVKTLHLKNKELEQFSYVVSHDLKTPIRGIGGLAEMIEEDLKPYFEQPDASRDVQDHLHNLHKHVDRMTDLTNGILEFSRVGPITVDTKPIVLRDMVSAFVSSFKLAPDQLVLDGDVDTIRHDPCNFRRVMENLVSNAIRFHTGPDRLLIRISARMQGAMCCVSVQDNGPGIAPTYQKRIFEVFQTLRLNNAPESTGIGLAIVKKAVERHGGTIRVTSEPGKGATFRLDWPCSMPDTGTPLTAQEAA